MKDTERVIQLIYDYFMVTQFTKNCHSVNEQKKTPIQIIDNFITLNECDIIDGEMDIELQPHKIQEEYELSEQDDLLLSQLLRSRNNSNTAQNQ